MQIIIREWMSSDHEHSKITSEGPATSTSTASSSSSSSSAPSSASASVPTCSFASSSSASSLSSLSSSSSSSSSSPSSSLSSSSSSSSSSTSSQLSSSRSGFYPPHEFRCFVYHRRLTAVTQYYSSCCAPRLVGERTRVKQMIFDKWKEVCARSLSGSQRTCGVHERVTGDACSSFVDTRACTCAYARVV